MLSRTQLKRFDRDFRILQSLCTQDYGPVPNSVSRHVYRWVHGLIDLGLIDSKKGHGGGYRLTIPLDEIRLSLWLDHMNVNMETPTGRLLSLFKTSSVQQLLQYPPIEHEGGEFLLDHVVQLLNKLSTHKPIRISNIRYQSMSPDYMKHIFSALVHCGLVTRIPQKGVILTRNFDTLVLKDIVPVIPQNCRIFSAMVKCVADLKLNDLLSDHFYVREVN